VGEPAGDLVARRGGGGVGVGCSTGLRSLRCSPLTSVFVDNPGVPLSNAVVFFRSFYRLGTSANPPLIRRSNDARTRCPKARPLLRGHLRGPRSVTGKERRSWHPAGTDRVEAEALAARLAVGRDGRNDEVRSLTFGAYLTSQWLPAKKLTLKTSTYRGYVRKTQRHILPALGHKRLRRLRPQDLEQLYDSMLQPAADRPALAPKTVYEVHLIIRGALAAAVRRGLVNRNVAVVAAAPRMRSIPRREMQVWTSQELQIFLRAAAGHRLFPALWLAAMTGVRRSELLGLRWTDGIFVDSSHGPFTWPNRSSCGRTVSSASANRACGVIATPSDRRPVRLWAASSRGYQTPPHPATPTSP
jgi:hypothetical protein